MEAAIQGDVREQYDGATKFRSVATVANSDVIDKGRKGSLAQGLSKFSCARITENMLEIIGALPQSFYLIMRWRPEFCILLQSCEIRISVMLFIVKRIRFRGVN